ncbi:hypothetical protein EXIGLDRAFT_737121 [Exidia glandulosa HHB12029]|uniref:Uncharacterized protein n=1 Tax=Exidia glandulosa HHB12029 TaxID=1314781 RepID=A0A165J5U2_EXIGL|nr:hypothetical protein EXIGLDRAFT_737121 [Exidia glandulosa HHB12029]
MRPTVAALGKASRRPLIGKRANKDFYKGYGAARLPGGHRTGAPGKHVIAGKAKYRVIDEQVRVFVAPPIEHILSSPLKPYVYREVPEKGPDDGPYQQQHLGGFPGEYWLRVMRERHGSSTAGSTQAAPAVNAPTTSSATSA